MTRITDIDVHDVRFPTSRTLDGSDAMQVAPDHSLAYVVMRTDSPGSTEGHGFTFTCGRGTEIVVTAIESLAPMLRGARVSDLANDLGGVWRALAGEHQLRWIGPEKGAVHLATAALINALWDLLAKRAGMPLWQYLAEMPPEALVEAIDFRHIRDAMDPERALTLLRAAQPGREERMAQLAEHGYPAYVTSVGWLGFDDDEVRQRCRQALAEGWTQFKMKVGADLEDDRRRAALIRDEIGERPLMVDANQVWEIDEAIAWISELAEFDLRWVEEPISPDDVLGHRRIAEAIAPIGVATGEQAQNRVLLKQMFQAGALRYCQFDACRLGGVNEVLAVLLLAADHEVPVCQHAGALGLRELAQHIAAFDYVAVSTSLDDRVTEYADHFLEHFVDPARVRDGRYVLPGAPGFSAELHPESLAAHEFPHGPVWADVPSRLRPIE